MSELRAAVIGLGVGEEHIDAYSSHPGCEVVAICDISPQRLEQVGGRHPGIRRTQRPEEILKDPEIDVVSIASYDDFHYPQVKRALENGKHVFVEKPLCQEEEQAREIHSLLREHPQLHLSSNLPLRGSPRFKQLRALLGEGELGTPYYLEGDYDYGRVWKLTEGWRGDLERYSVFLGGAVHMVDLILWLTGDSVVRVSAAGNAMATAESKYRFEDLVVALLELESGLVAKVSANFGCVHPHFHGLKVFGTEGTFINDLGDAILWRPGEDGPESTPLDAAYPGVGKGDLIPSFVESILRGSDPDVSAGDVFRSMAVCFAVDRALAAGQPSEVKDFG